MGKARETSESDNLMVIQLVVVEHAEVTQWAGQPRCAREQVSSAYLSGSLLAWWLGGRLVPGAV
jgi:hypothetical protein